MAIEIRGIRPHEHEVVGELTVDAYMALRSDVASGGYEDELRAVGRRAAEAVVLVAVDGDEILGGVTYVPDESSPWAEDLAPGEAGIRMLAVRPAAQGRGAGRLLTEACIDRAAADGKQAVFLHSTPWMTTAHGIYERLGFVRVPERDWSPLPEVPLLAFRLDLARYRGSARPGGGTGQTRGA